MTIRVFQRSFGGGEVTPEFWGRIDDAKYQSGVTTCRNMLVKPQGPLENRAGTQFVREVKTSAKKTRLISFTYSTTQTMVIEVGEFYLRFHTAGSTLLYSAPAAHVTTSTVTITIATPGVITWTGHTLVAGDTVRFTTTGALPTGLAANTTYYVVNPATNTFQVAATAGGTAITTSGTQSGTHTALRYYEVGSLVSKSGVNYYCVLAHSNQVPPNATYWYALPSNPNIYEIPTPYAEADLMDIKYVQSADVLTLVHPSYAPRELRRYGATDWRLASIAFASALVAPTGVGAVATGGTGTTYSYVVTSVGTLGTDESVQSTAATCSGNLYATNAYNTITWAAASGAQRYYVYRLSGGLYGYVGQADGLTFKDDNIAADTSRTPPISQSLFNSTNNYPSAVSYFEQRRVFAGTNSQPQNVWMTKSGTESNMDYSLPIRDDDSIQFRIAAREANTIRHIVPLTTLLLLTSGGEWKVGNGDDALTPANVNVTPQSYTGISNVAPVMISNNIVYAAARGGHVREMSYAYQSNGYVSGDLSLRSPHLFDGYEVVDMAYSKAPYPIIWVISNSGKVLGFTYMPEQQIGAWHQHDTDGTFEAVTTVAEGAEDVPYFVVRRTINGQTKRYIERLRPRAFAAQADAYFVDCGLTYSGSAATVITGLSHLEGKTVSILGDGAVMPQQVVTGGQITLPQAVTKAQVGLPITADVETLPIAFEAPDFGQGMVKNVNRVMVRVFKSGGIFVGPDFNNLVEAKQRTNEPWGTAPSLKTEVLRIDLSPSWGTTGQVCLRQADPLPLTLVSMTIEATVGG